MMITIKNIEAAKEIYSNLEGWKFARDSITTYFKNNKDNFDEETVLIKVLFIDSLYKTKLREPTSVIKHILLKGKDLNKKLKEGDISIVEDIADWKDRTGKKIHILSFASKFCHFHNKKDFPIYDKYACIALRDKIKYKDKRDYKAFKQNVEKIRISLHVKGFEDVDTFLWLYGQKLKIEYFDKKNAERKINIEVSNLYDKKNSLFGALE